VVCVITEITDLVHREERLRVSEALAAAARAQLEAALAAHSEGFALYDANDRLVICNDRYRAMFADAAPNILPGVGFEELLRTSVAGLKADLGDFDRDKYVARRIAAHANPGKPFETRLFDGRWVQIRERRTEEGGIVCVVTDVNAIKTAEAAMRTAMEQAEQANQAKTRFLAAASHDLRQPLHALGMFVAALEERVRGRETRQIVENVGLTVEALESLLNALLDISKLDAGAVRPEFADLQLAPLLQRLHAEYVPQAREKGLRFRLVPSAASVRSDPALLESVVRNLLSNAIRYTNSGAVLVGCRRRGTHIVLEVRDSGVGIPPDQIANVFREFYRLDEVTGNSAPGAGLGLAIVERTARLLGHRLEVQSELGRGSIFRIELPQVEAADRISATARPTELLGDPLRGCSLIVIDDDRLVLESMRRLLEGWGCRVLAAGSAEAALIGIDAFGMPDLIVADYRLRIGTGPQAIEAIRRRLQNRTPAIIITGETGRGEPGDLATAGLVVLRKPIAPAKLRSLLSHSLRHPAREPTSA
jgi:signal transduction histidine kinase/CheY-like chemotaxis protein